MKSYYLTCPTCGANLDPSEVCEECRQKDRLAYLKKYKNVDCLRIDPSKFREALRHPDKYGINFEKDFPSFTFYETTTHDCVVAQDDEVLIKNGRIETFLTVEQIVLSRLLQYIEENVSMDADSKITIYTDGCCLGNPGIGGWGAVIIVNGKLFEFNGKSEVITTNNQMELIAVIAALKALGETGASYNITILTDSSYVCNNAEKYLAGWVRKGWRTGDGGEVKNPVLWQYIWEMMCRHKIVWKHVKGHANNEYNERCDTLAKLGAKGVFI